MNANKKEALWRSAVSDERKEKSLSLWYVMTDISFDRASTPCLASPDGSLQPPEVQ